MTADKHLGLSFVPEQEGQEGRKAKAAWLERLYVLADQARRHYEPDWFQNISYLAGNQREQEAFAGDVLRYRRVPLPVPTRKAWLAINHIYGMVRQASATLQEALGRQVCVPATSDEEDVQAASLGSDFLLSRSDEEEALRLIELVWTMTTGRVLRMTQYDPWASGEGLTGPVPGLGDVETMTLNPWRFHYPPWAETGRLPEWVIVSEVRDTDEINDIYGAEVQPEQYADAARYLDRLLMNVVGQQGSVGAGTPPARSRACVLKRLYAAPTREQLKGRMFVWANGVELPPRGGVELPEGEMPFVPIEWFPIPGRLYPLPFVSPLRDIAREINVAVSQIIELKNRQLRGDIVVRGVGDVTHEWDEETGQKKIRLAAGILEYDFLRYDLKVADAERLLMRLWNEFMQVAGMHEQSMGQNPPRGVTATQVQVLRESDLRGLTLFRAGLDSGHSRVGRQKLLVARNHFKMARMVRVTGYRNQVRVRSFYGADLRNTQDVRPKARPLLTEAMKAQIRVEAVAAGLLGPYAGPEDQLAKLVALEAMGLPDDEIEWLMSGVTADALREEVNEINRLKARAALDIAEAAAAAAELQRIQAVTALEAATEQAEQGQQEPEPMVPGEEFLTQPRPPAQPAGAPAGAAA